MKTRNAFYRKKTLDEGASVFGKNNEADKTSDPIQSYPIQSNPIHGWIQFMSDSGLAVIINREVEMPIILIILAMGIFKFFTL